MTDTTLARLRAIRAAAPLLAMIYILVVLTASLGLWMIRADDLVAWLAGGREYALSVSVRVLAVVLLAWALIRRPPTRRQVAVAAPAVVVLAVWSLIGISHHGLAQTFAGARITVLPAILLIVALAFSARELDVLLTATAVLMIANGVAAVVEYAIGPAQLVAWGFEEGRGVRLIGDTFRAPGLTQVNAELGLLAGSFLLGYLALWLVRDLRPRRLVWHLAAVAAVVALALSTSRSGALLVAGGLVGAVLLNRGGGPAARRRARVLGVAIVVVLGAGFAAVGATGMASLVQRFGIWGDLLESGGSWTGAGVGGAGAATYSRVASSAQVFVDNYFISIVLQYGYVIAAVVIALIGWGLVRLSVRSAARPEYAVHLALLAGAAAGAMMIELWEYPLAMVCLALFLAYTRARSAPAAADRAAGLDRAVALPAAPRPVHPGDTPPAARSDS